MRLQQESSSVHVVMQPQCARPGQLIMRHTWLRSEARVGVARGGGWVPKMRRARLRSMYRFWLSRFLGLPDPAGARVPPEAFGATMATRNALSSAWKHLTLTPRRTVDDSQDNSQMHCDHTVIITIWRAGSRHRQYTRDVRRATRPTRPVPWARDPARGVRPLFASHARTCPPL